jgi:malonyl-CoA/methylmalonyl-CoA synthetase
VSADTGEIGEPGEIGDVQVRGPGLFTGYLNRPDATAAGYTTDGWFRTGDIGRFRPDGGELELLGRRSTDLISSGGYKIGAGEIENTLLEHPGVAEAAVVGVADADLGERVVAWVVPVAEDDRPSEAELVDLVASQLAPHKRPREIRFTAELPRNDLGKVVKAKLPR